MHKRTAAAGTSRRLWIGEHTQRQRKRGRMREREGAVGFLFITATCIAFCLYAFNAISTLFTLIYAQASGCWVLERRTNHRVLQPVKAHTHTHTHECMLCFLLFAYLFVCLFVCLSVCLSRFCQRIYECQRGFHLLWRPFCPFVRWRIGGEASPFVCHMTAWAVEGAGAGAAPPCSLCARRCSLVYATIFISSAAATSLPSVSTVPCPSPTPGPSCSRSWRRRRSPCHSHLRSLTLLPDARTNAYCLCPGA